MSLVLDDLPRDPDRLLLMAQQMAEVIAQQYASIVSLQTERDAAQSIAVAPSRQARPMEASDEAFPLARLRVRRGEVLGSEERAQPECSCCGLSRLRFKPELRVSSRQHGPRPCPVRLPPEVSLQDFHRVLRPTREIVDCAEFHPGRFADRVERE